MSFGMAFANSQRIEQFLTLTETDRIWGRSTAGWQPSKPPPAPEAYQLYFGFRTFIESEIE
jgi:hypothetical protein